MGKDKDKDKDPYQDKYKDPYKVKDKDPYKDKDRDKDQDPGLSVLQEKLAAQENEIEKLRQMLQVLAGNEGQNIREAKILELFKRNRDLNLSLEKERGKARSLKSQLDLIKEEIIRKKEAELASGAADDKKMEKEISELQQWKEKYNQVNAKLMEVQAGRSMLNAEINKLQHALQREVGEHIPLSKVLEEGGDWKGRSQQISLLKDKLREIKAKLQKNALKDFEQSQFEDFEKARSREFEKLGNELQSTKEELASIKQRLEVVLARRSVLENELKCAKEKMAMLVGKSDNDDRLISALRLELEAHKQGDGPILYGQKVGGPLSLDLLQRQHRLAGSFNELKRHCYQQELQIQAQNELIEYLRGIVASQHEKETVKGETNEANKEKVEYSVNEKMVGGNIEDSQRSMEVH